MINPWTREDWNVTAQGQFVMQYGEEAGRRMAQRAGLKKLGDTHPKPPAAKIYIIQGKQGPKGDPGDGAGTAAHEFLGFYGPGTFTADQLFTLSATPRAVTFPTATTDESRATCRVAPTADATFYLVADVTDFEDDGTSLICTVTFLAGQLTGSFLYNGTNNIDVDTALFLICPHVPDPTLTDIQLVFCGDPQ